MKTKTKKEEESSLVKPRLVPHSYMPNTFVVRMGKRVLGSVEPSRRDAAPWLYRSALVQSAADCATTRAAATRALVALDAKIVRPETLSLEAPIEGFRSPGGRRFVVADGMADDRLVMPSWRHDFRVYLMIPGSEPKHVGDLYRSWTYGMTAEGEPRWCGSLSRMRWATTFDTPRGCGYDVSAFDSVEACAEAWMRSADQILDHVKDKVA